jgi:Rrf2 family protein
MKLITRNTDYALRAICYIAKRKTVVTVAELVKTLSVPHSFMRKILQQLNRNKILKSYKGQLGGFKLNLLPQRISIIQIMRIFQGQVSLNECFLKKDICPNKIKCILRKKIRRIENDVLTQLGQIDVASLIRG